MTGPPCGLINHEREGKAARESSPLFRADSVTSLQALLFQVRKDFYWPTPAGLSFPQ